MTTQRDDMAGPDAADPALGQAVPAGPATRGPASDDDRVVLDDPVPAADRILLDDPVAADADEPVADDVPAAVPAAREMPSADEVPAADSPDTTPAAALAEQQWPAIQSLFVDDPRGAVERAAAAAGEVTASLVATLEREQAELRASWQQDADTERLRTALQRYRAFCGRLEGLA